MLLPAFELQCPQVRQRSLPPSALIGTCSSVTVLPEDACWRVNLLKQIGQTVFPRSNRRSRLRLPVFRDMRGDDGLVEDIGQTIKGFE